jgi:hypothetical protein|tara:strand:- start:861 stop:1088 length:228 start_codon:yes stop_codon:yes gene_type:complete
MSEGDLAQSERMSYRESERAEEGGQPPSPPAGAAGAGAPVPPLEINGITILKNVAKIKSRRQTQRSKANNINAMM